MAQAERWAPSGASGTSLDLAKQCLDIAGAALPDVRLFVADVGPGSFIGVRVGVTLAKTLAMVNGAECAGVTSFDLIDRMGTVVIPSKKGEFFVRPYGEPAIRASILPDEPFTGFGEGVPEFVYPSAVRVASFVRDLEAVAPEALMPRYLIEPSISTPKKPYKQMENR